MIVFNFRPRTDLKFKNQDTNKKAERPWSAFLFTWFVLVEMKCLLDLLNKWIPSARFRLFLLC